MEGGRKGKEVRQKARLVPPSCPFLASGISEHNKKTRRKGVVGWKENDVDFSTLN